jgi:transposase
MQKTLYVGLDVHKASISVTVAEEGRDGPITFIGTIPNTPIAVTKLCKRLGKECRRLEFCYEAGCCGYVIYRHLIGLGHRCTVVCGIRGKAATDSERRRPPVERVRRGALSAV